ncbi:hypothetical protein HAX54_015568 [Datura stramonium]|uniref:Uncharacterized protein n=1 Tax=Datura stramonium TaxID=4076 RepID=A0ABS8RGU6_DATST|nr:hypothetical protein [Datura stramonium]
MTLEEKDRKTDEEDLQEENDPDMTPEKDAQIRTARLESLMDQRTYPKNDKEAGTLVGAIPTISIEIPTCIGLVRFREFLPLLLLLESTEDTTYFQVDGEGFACDDVRVLPDFLVMVLSQ